MALTFEKLRALLRERWAAVNKPGTVASKLSKLQTFCNARGCCDDVAAALADPNALMAWLEERYANESTRLNMLSTLVSVIATCRDLELGAASYDHLYECMCNMSKARSNKRELNETPAYLQEHHMTYDDLVNAFDTLPSSAPQLDKLLIALYTCIPPRRLEHGTLQYTTSVPPASECGNYVVLQQPVLLVFREYKTVGSLGEVTLQLEDSHLLPRAGTLGQLLQDSYDADPRRYVFGNKQWHSQFSLRVKNTFAKWTPWQQITVRLIRKLYATHLAGGRPLSTADKSALARLAGHSLMQSDTYKMLDVLQHEYDTNAQIKEHVQQILEDFESLQQNAECMQQVIETCVSLLQVGEVQEALQLLTFVSIECIS